jgi:beta-mannosidase
MFAQEITTGWSFAQEGTDEWLPVKKVPTNVHLDLIDNGKQVLLPRSSCPPC